MRIITNANLGLAWHGSSAAGDHGAGVVRAGRPARGRDRVTRCHSRTVCRSQAAPAARPGHLCPDRIAMRIQTGTRGDLQRRRSASAIAEIRAWWARLDLNQRPRDYESEFIWCNDVHSILVRVFAQKYCISVGYALNLFASVRGCSTPSQVSMGTRMGTRFWRRVIPWSGSESTL